MENVIHIYRQYCDVCGKLIYEKDLSTNSKSKGNIPVDFYEVTFYSYDENLFIDANRDQPGLYHRVVCSQKCISDSVLPVYFTRVNAKRNSKHNSEGIRIRHVYSI